VKTIERQREGTANNKEDFGLRSITKEFPRSHAACRSTRLILSCRIQHIHACFQASILDTFLGLGNTKRCKTTMSSNPDKSSSITLPAGVVVELAYTPDTIVFIEARHLEALPIQIGALLSSLP